MSDFYNEDNKKEECFALVPVHQENFYNEVINKKPQKDKKRVFALVLAIGLLLGTAFGYSLDNFDLLTGKAPQEKVYATQNESKMSAVIQSASPVVPIAKKVSPAIVAIKTKTKVRDFFGDVYLTPGTGSGIIIDSDGYIVTNNHVIDGAKDMLVVLNDGRELEATLIGSDSITDIAVIKVDEKNLPFAELGDSSKLEVGELAVAIGSPMGAEYAGSVTAGVISGIDRKVNVGDRTMNLIQTDAAINPGNSGGALCNGEGRVIGINTLKLVESKVEGMGFAIPINEAKPIIDQLKQNKKIVRPYIGINGATITKEDGEKYNIPVGVYVADVIPYSGADRAGLKRGDIITKIDGKKTETIEALIEIIRAHKVGDVVEVEIYDELDKTKTVSVKLKENNE